MKFSDIEKSQWEELKPYLDTCLIPYTALSGAEEPWGVTEQLERLRDVMDLIEMPFKGRIVTYPAVQYDLGQAHEALPVLSRIAAGVKTSGFKWVVVASVKPLAEADEEGAAEHIDAFLHADMSSSEIRDKILKLWEK